MVFTCVAVKFRCVMANGNNFGNVNEQLERNFHDSSPNSKRYKRLKAAHEDTRKLLASNPLSDK